MQEAGSVLPTEGRSDRRLPGHHAEMEGRLQMTDCEIRIVRHDGVQMTFDRCAERLQCFALYDAYEEYDAFASADEQVTRRQFAAVNEAMMANIKFDDWRRFVSPNLVPHLAEVPKD